MVTMHGQSTLNKNSTVLPSGCTSATLSSHDGEHGIVKLNVSPPLRHLQCGNSIPLQILRASELRCDGRYPPSEVGIQAETWRTLTSNSGHHTGLLILPDTLFEKIGLTLQGNELHPIEWIAGTK